VVIFAVQVVCALPAERPRAMPPGRRPSVVVLVPAHNESLLIADTLRSISSCMAPGDRLLVVADNCTDDTARIAAANGAEVIERNDTSQRGKIHALDFGIRHLESNPPEVVLVIDADCRIEGGAIERVAKLCVEKDRPVQALYLMRASTGAGLMTRIGEFAWLVKNQVRPTGFYRLGLPCQLMGAGGAFPWRRISAVAFTGGYMAEDYKLGIDLARGGGPVLFCPEARVTSYFAPTKEGVVGQRTRWEHGHIALIIGAVPRLFLEAVAKGDLLLFGLALDLSVPPLALLLLLVLASFFASMAFYAVVNLGLPLALATAALSLLGVSVLLSWVRYARNVISLRELASALTYAIWKIPLYLNYFVNRQVEWVRSRRDGE
jgi:cellulose synthase/poly-beta-1,6-N-acetylglucosamine synthase-like glycosyltransferase